MKKKETYYFSHDYPTTHDPKIQALLGKYGARGYGIYWRIVEILHEDPTHKIQLKPYIFEAIASTLKAEVKYIKEIINYMVETCELFIKKDNYIYSERVLNNIEKRDKIKEARSLAGKRSAEARKNLTNVKQTLTTVEQKPTKKSKQKEIKLNNLTINKVELMDFFNNTFNKNLKIFSQLNETKLKARLKEGYTIEDVKKAMLNCTKDTFHKENNFKYCNLEYFTRSQTIDKYSAETLKTQKYIPTK